MNHDVDFSIVRNGAAATVAFPPAQSGSVDVDGNFESRDICSCEACLKSPSETLKCICCGACYFAEYDANFSDKFYEFDIGDEISMCHRMGTLHWLCKSCKTLISATECKTMFQVFNKVRPTKPVEPLPSSAILNLVQQLDQKLCQMQEDNKVTFLDIQNQLADLKESPQPLTLSPDRKRRKAVGNDSFISDSMPFRALFDGNVPAPSVFQQKLSDPVDQIKPKSKSPTKVKLNVKLNDTMDTSTFQRNLNRTVKDFPKYFVKSKNNSAIDIMVENYSKALEAKKVLEEKFVGLSISRPHCADAGLFNIVGVPYGLSEDEVLESLIADNPNLRLKKSDDDVKSLICAMNPNARLSLRNILKCRAGGVYRLVVELTKDMQSVINGKSIIVEKTYCKIYSIRKHDNCFKCWKKGHFVQNCTNSSACGRCAGEHLTRDCPDSNIIKCILCTRNGISNCSHEAFSCPHT